MNVIDFSKGKQENKSSGRFEVTIKTIESRNTTNTEIYYVD
jgi:hypothetical protein